MSGNDVKLRRWLRVVGIFFLVEGLLMGALVFLRAEPPEVNEYLIPPQYTKGYEAGMQTFGGKANLVAAEFREWIASLWHGKRLAYTLVVLGGGLCAVCFYLGWFLTDLPPEHAAKRTF